MNNLFSNIFKKREKVIIPLQEEIENLEFLLRIKENNSNIRDEKEYIDLLKSCLLYTSPSPRDTR